MQPGISTACLYPRYTEESLRDILALRPACVEVFINAREELSAPFLRGLRAMADSAGARIASVHPYLSAMEPLYFFSGYSRRFLEGREEYKRHYEAAGMLGAEAVVFHGNFYGNEIPPGQYFERFSVLWEDARREGISLCQENVERCASREPGFFKQMRSALADAEFILDVKQAVRAGQNPFEMANAMGGKIKHVHLSDHTGAQSCLPPGRGVFNIREFLEHIAKNGFSGSVIVELYRENFKDIVELSAGFQHLSYILSTIA
ncbi:MAG: sugar phosphate isomerase/epimerase [Oscillospiraceae bacterium]|nr:sugar phosphate isomerase/epimerase [Oscillospiraceae bacterium]